MNKTKNKKGKKLIICGTGCALADNLYGNIDFSSACFVKYLSKETADGGLSPGKLVFTEEFEKFARSGFREILYDITKGKAPDSFNVGGPAIVSLIHTAQLLHNLPLQVKFYGARGNDMIGKRIDERLNELNLDLSNYMEFASPSPFTDVFSDPSYEDGKGERIFVNNIGAAWNFKSEDLDTSFFDADIVTFGGTALVPNIHDNLTDLLQSAKQKNCFTFVNTVYDFRNEKSNPGEKWPLVEANHFNMIDLLIMDKEEALMISGKDDVNQAMDFFNQNQAKAIVITQGADPILFFANDGPFRKTTKTALPVSKDISEQLSKGQVNGDTTGCGDNFAGGVLASIARQIISNSDILDLEEAVKWGIVSGGQACFYYGGVYSERFKGEKLELISDLYIKYDKS